MTAFAAVLFYILWMILLTLLYATPRIPQALFGIKPIDSWERNKAPVDPPVLQRIKAAHLNSIESFALFAGVVVIAALMGKVAVADSVAAYILYARIAQGVAHALGTSFVLVLLRATFFLVQMALIGYIAVSLLQG